MVGKQGDQQYNSGRCRVPRSILKYLGVLDLASECRLTWRWVQIWIVESSSVWGNVWSIIKTECARSHEMERCRRRGWNLEVSPNR